MQSMTVNTALQAHHFMSLEAAWNLSTAELPPDATPLTVTNGTIATANQLDNAFPQPEAPGDAPPDNSQDLQEQQERLVVRALQGEQAAFTEIVDQYSALMLRTATMIVGDADTAEDIVQDTFIQAWHHLAELRRAGALRPWLMRIVVNQCISLKRRTARCAAFIRQSLLEHETDLLAQAADEHKGCLERNWDLAQSIDLLPYKQRVVIILHYYYSMTLPEMAHALNISENTLKKRIQAALINLRRILHISAERLDDLPVSAFSVA